MGPRESSFRRLRMTALALARVGKAIQFATFHTRFAATP